MKTKNDIIGIVLSVLGIILSVHFYIQTKTQNSIALITNPIRTTFIENNVTNTPSNIKVFFDTTLINSNLHSLYFYLFNNGGVKFSENEIREPILISLSEKNTIHNVRIIKTTHPNTQFTINQIFQNTVQIKFKELYPNDGITAQIIFEGEKENKLYATANIVGIDRISNRPISTYKFYLYVTLCFVILLILFGFYIKIKGVRIAKEDQYKMEDIDNSKELNQAKNNIINTGDSVFVKIMNIIAPIIMISIIIGLMILAYSIIESIISQNPEWYIPEPLKIKINTQ